MDTPGRSIAVQSISCVQFMDGNEGWYRVLYWPCVEIVAKSLVGHGGFNPPMNLPDHSQHTKIVIRDVLNSIRVGVRVCLSRSLNIQSQALKFSDLAATDHDRQRFEAQIISPAE